MRAADPGSFAAYVAHELRTPLATERALLELTIGDPHADLATWREVGEDVLRACKQQERLLEACLALARSQEGPAIREPVDLSTIAARALRAHEPVGLANVVALAPAPTSGDPNLLERLASNLVSNAIRHNVAGGRIDITTRSEPGHAVLRVSNTGRPIPAAEVPRLFEPFGRFGPSTGVGLGLTIVQAVADVHAASVSARARSGGGLDVAVAFPALPDPGVDHEIEPPVDARADMDSGRPDPEANSRRRTERHRIVAGRKFDRVAAPGRGPDAHGAVAGA
jgi:signal transduction histidine kinase